MLYALNVWNEKDDGGKIGEKENVMELVGRHERVSRTFVCASLGFLCFILIKAVKRIPKVEHKRWGMGVVRHKTLRCSFN